MSQGMVVRLLRPLLAILVAVALVGAPAIQAATAVPCDAMPATAAHHQASPGSAEAPAPCKGIMPACIDVLGCVSIPTLPGPEASHGRPVAWTRVAYWDASGVREGLSLEPALHPPIPFA